MRAAGTPAKKIPMNRRTRIISNEVKARHALLSPDLFLVLDQRSRHLAKRPIRVRTLRDMVDDNGRQLWGSLNFFTTLVCLDLRLLADDTDAPKYREVSVIDLAIRVPLADFRAARRPEINWRQVPDDRVIEYIVMHEIGHAVDNFRVDITAPHSDDVQRALHICNEVLADRFAWNSMFPATPLPKDPERTTSQHQVKKWMRLLQDAGIPRGHRNPSRAQLPHDPLTFVPADNIERPVRWPTGGESPEASAYIAAVRKAVVDSRNARRRSWRRQADEWIAAWREFKRAPSASRIKELRSGRMQSHARLLAAVRPCVPEERMEGM